MADVPIDVCMHCSKEYALSKETARLQLFVRTPEYNFIQCNCPHCNNWTRIFLSVEGTCAFIERLPIYLHADAPKDVQEGFNRLNVAPDVAKEAGDVSDLSDLPDLPPDLRRQLYDWMRENDHE